MATLDERMLAVEKTTNDLKELHIELGRTVVAIAKSDKRLEATIREIGESNKQNKELIRISAERIRQNEDRIRQNEDLIRLSAERIRQNGERIRQNGERIRQNEMHIRIMEDYLAKSERRLAFVEDRAARHDAVMEELSREAAHSRVALFRVLNELGLYDADSEE